MKLAAKINLLFTVIVSGILLVIALIIFNVSRQNVHTDFKQRLKTRAVRTAYLFDLFYKDSSYLLQSLDANTPPALFNKSISVYNEKFELLYHFHDDSTDEVAIDTGWFRKIKGSGETYFVYENKLVYGFFDQTQVPPIYVFVAAENVAGQNYINDLKSLFILFFPGAVLFTLIVGFLFSRNIIKPVKETIRDVQLITSQNLSHRLYEGKSKDELSELNSTFNDLLDRLEESFAIQRRFISNASHELSTPLTSVSSQMEVALIQERTGHEYRRVLQSALEDVRQLQELTKTLLEIAKAGTHGTISLDKVRIDEIIIKSHSDVLKLNPQYHIKLEFSDLPENEDECMVFGNAHLLQSAFKNIMENGGKYSPDGRVNVRLNFWGESAEIIFQNQGDIIPDAELSNLFEPFYRGSNAEGKQGVGLGLTLTRRIINLHKGTLSMESSQEKGTLFTVVLPTLKK